MITSLSLKMLPKAVNDDNILFGYGFLWPLCITKNNLPDKKKQHLSGRCNLLSKSQSPTSMFLPVFGFFTLLMPTSMIAHPGLSMSPCISPGIPVATTNISAFFT